MSISCWSCWSDQWLHYTVKGHARLKILVLRQASISLAIDTYHYNYRILGNLAAIKFGEMARNCSDKYLANLKFGDLHNQIESYDITCAAYEYSHFSPWITCTRTILSMFMPDCRRWRHMRLYPWSSCILRYFEPHDSPMIGKQLVCKREASNTQDV